MMTLLLVLAVAGFVGWSITLIFLMRSLLPMANALAVVGKLNAHIDNQIRAVIERYESLRNPKVPALNVSQGKAPGNERDPLGAVRGLLEPNMGPARPLGEQPDNTEGLEIAGV